jgi:4-hydroxythreonine-4-phosphate dehydrogenase
MGDPAGIGPEVVLKAVAEEEIRKVCVPVIIGDAQLLLTLRELSICKAATTSLEEKNRFRRTLRTCHLSPRQHQRLYRARHRIGCGRKSSGWLHRSCGRVVRGGSIDAIATAPINKRALVSGRF